MKLFISGLVGVFVTVLIVIIYANYKNNFLQNDNIGADEIFSGYLNQKTQQEQDIISQKKQMEDYSDNLLWVKTAVDTMHLNSITISKDTNETIRAIQQTAQSFYSTLNQIRNMINDSSSNQYISTANSKIISSLYGEFNLYTMPLYNEPKTIFGSIEEAVSFYNNVPVFTAHKKSIQTIIERQKTSVAKAILNMDASTKELDAAMEDVRKARRDATENTRDKLLISMVIPVFAVMLGVIIFIPYLLRSNTDLFKKILDDKILIQVFTIFILVISILLLGIGNKLSGETLGTLLGGISVYVLQKSLENNTSSASGGSNRNNGGQPPL